MRSVNPLKTGLVFGVVLGLAHLAWAVLVALRLAQPLIDVILRLHFISLPIQIQPFEMTTAVMLVAVTAAAGFILGLVVGIIWNSLHPAGGPSDL